MVPTSGTVFRKGGEGGGCSSGSRFSLIMPHLACLMGVVPLSWRVSKRLPCWQMLCLPLLATPASFVTSLYTEKQTCGAKKQKHKNNLRSTVNCVCNLTQATVLFFIFWEEVFRHKKRLTVVLRSMESGGWGFCKVLQDALFFCCLPWDI